MSLFKFENGDVIKNTIIANPKNKFLIYDGITIYNDTVQESGTDWDDDGEEDLTKFIPPGHISLYELNIDRPTGSGDSGMIRPFTKRTSGYLSDAIPKVQQLNANGEITEYIAVQVSGELVAATASLDANNNVVLAEPLESEDPMSITQYLEFLEENEINEVYGSYPLSSSITPRYVEVQGGNIVDDTLKMYAHSLINTINYYKYVSIKYDSISLFSDDFNIVSVPSVFYGNKIKPGSVKISYIPPENGASVKQEITDSKRNGELHNEAGQFCGIVLYNEGFVILSGTGQSLSTDPEHTWADFGKNIDDVAWSLEFDGINKVPVLTMFAHARKSELNHSNNPSWLKVRNSPASISDRKYAEPSNKEIRNITKNELIEADPVFKKETYISKIAIYDKHKKIIGYAKLARPIRKTEERELTFKLKLDL